MMPDKPSIKKLLDGALSNISPDFADIFFEDVTSTSVVFEDNKVDRLASGSDAGYGIRTITGKEVDYRYFSCPGELRSKPDVPAEKKMELVRKANDAARSLGGFVRQVTVSYSDKVQSVVIADSKGRFRSGKRIFTRFVVNVIAEKNGVLQTGYETAGATKGFELFNETDVASLSKKAAERTLMMLDAKHAPSGEMPVVIMSEAGGTLIHEACGHGLEADFIVKEMSVYHGKVGQKVASELITVIDDATLPGLYGSFEFDDEGTPSKRKVLIENGVLRTFMSDTYNSKILGMTSSGNGRRESYCSKPQPRMTNTYIEKGKTDPMEIISSVKNGLLVKKLGGGQVNVANGDFVFDVQEGYLIEKGYVKEPVRGAMLTGNGPKILSDIDMVGNDLHFITGTCGKGDHAPVTDAMPTIRIPKIVVGGRD